MYDLEIGVACACVASILFDLGVALQAMEARDVSHDHSLRPSLLGRLVARPRWVFATLLGVAGWPFHVVALLLAPLTVVQPALASGLLLLLVLGDRMLGERVGSLEVGAVMAIILGVAGMAWAAPSTLPTTPASSVWRPRSASSDCSPSPRTWRGGRRLPRAPCSR